MKLSVSTLTCPEWEIDRICSYLRSVGIHRVDLRKVSGRVDLWNVDGLSSEAIFREYGIEVSGISSSIRVDSTGVSGPNDNGIDAFERYVELCNRLGGSYIRIFAGDRPENGSDSRTPTDVDPTSRERLSMVAERYAQLCELCAAATSNRVDVLVETHDVISSSAAVFSLVELVAHPRAGVVWDVLHPLRHAGESMEYTAEKLREVTRLVHVKDFAGPPGYELVEFGTGTLDPEQIVAILDYIGYDGDIVLEQPRVSSTGKPAPEENIGGFADRFLPLVGATGEATGDT